MGADSFGALVAEARARLDLSGNRLAKQVEVSGTTISRIESGDRRAGLGVFVMLVRELGLDPGKAIDTVWEDMQITQNVEAT